MIDRVALFKLKPEHCTEAGREQIVEEARRVLSALPGVIQLTAGVPADSAAAASWDLLIVARFASEADAELYRGNPEHRIFADQYLAPRVEVKKAWSFRV